ncbi:MAG: CDP-alcohol phosphatidyltransferase family protein [Clostridiales bacterium]|nr:CDP-alcohol phosphatidyltransferase family protein [Clostridiales bacterium]
MNNKENDENKVKKIIPSKLETGFQKLLYKTLGKNIPKKMTPNQITTIGAIGGFIGIICAFLGKLNPLFLIGTILGLLCHLICDDLDGYVARTRNMSSKAGGYLDLLTDILHITYLIIALSFAGFVSFEIAIFLVPVYALIIFTAMNYILYLKEFLFPRLGPIETHLFFIVLCIGSILLGTNDIMNIRGIGLKFADIVFIVGGIPMYYEMIRLQIQLFKRLRIKDEDERKSK